MNGCSNYVTESEVCCTPCENENIREVCGCVTCNPIKLECSNIQQASCIPMHVMRIIDCANDSKSDVGVNQLFNFELDSLNDNYVGGQPVCIEKIGLSYDFIGLPELLLNSSQSYIEGTVYSLNPQNLFNVGTAESPVYLFNSLGGEISIGSCCCDIDVGSARLVRMVEYSKYFEVSNLNIRAAGYIGCTPFTAVAQVSDATNINSGVVRLTSLGITSSSTFDASLCIPNSIDTINIQESFDTSLNVDCIRPVSDYIPPEESPTVNGSFQAIVDFSFSVNKLIYTLKEDIISVFVNGNSVICRNDDTSMCNKS